MLPVPAGSLAAAERSTRHAYNYGIAIAMHIMMHTQWKCNHKQFKKKQEKKRPCTM
jgi:hypothetical protein